MSQTPLTPAGPGWYEDPQDTTLLRYFDGIVWTAHTTPRHSPTAESSTIGRATPGWPGDQPAWGGTGQQAGAPWQGSGEQAPGQWQQGAYGGYGPGWVADRADVLPDGAVLAQWWRRLLGRILDIVVTLVITVILSAPWLGQAATAMSDYLSRSVQAAQSGGTPPDQNAFLDQFVELALPVTLIGIAVSLGYELLFLTWRGATPGKMVVGTYVRRVEGEGRLSVVTVLRRQAIAVGTGLLGFVPVLSVFASGLRLLDPAWLLWDRKRQCLHDKLADTVVVLRNPRP